MLERNTASQKLELFAFDYATGAPKTGDAANLTAYVSIDDGVLTALTDTSATEISSTNAPGWYRFDLTQAETNGKKLHFTGKSSTADVSVVGRVVGTVPAYFSLSALDSSGRSQVQYGTSTGQINLSGGNLAGAVPSVTGAVGSVTGAVGSVTAGVTVTTNNDKAGYSLSSAGVQAIWDALTGALTAVGSIGKLLVDNINATISSRLASSSYTAPDNAGISTAATQATAAAASALSADGKLDTAFTNMKTRFLTMIESYSGGTLWRFLTGALSQAPSGGSGVAPVAIPALRWRTSWSQSAGEVPRLLASPGDDRNVVLFYEDASGDPAPVPSTITLTLLDAAGTERGTATLVDSKVGIGYLLVRLQIPSSGTMPTTLRLAFNGGTGATWTDNIAVRVS